MKILWNNTEYTKIISEAEYNSLEVQFCSNEYVPDSIRGELFYKSNKWNYKHYEKRIETLNLKGYKKIAIILESPHKDEYNSKDEPLFPAQGRTGCQIKKYLLNRGFISSLKKDKKYAVLLINPIQFQASCYKYLKRNNLKVKRSVTDKVFRFLFGKRGINLREDFIKRLKEYQPDIIVNCSTSGVKEVVGTAIKETGIMNIENVKSDKHPSVWNIYKF